MQERVTFEKEIRLAMQREAKEAEEGGPDDPDEDVEDPDEWWRDLQDGKATQPEPQHICRKKDLTALEATEELLNTYRPIRESVDELRRLLQAGSGPR